MEVTMMENEMVATGSVQAPMFRAGYRNLSALPQAPGLVTGCALLYPGASKLPTFMGNAVSGAITTLITTHPLTPKLPGEVGFSPTNLGPVTTSWAHSVKTQKTHINGQCDRPRTLLRKVPCRRDLQKLCHVRDRCAVHGKLRPCSLRKG